MSGRPTARRHGEPVCAIQNKLIERRDELALTVALTAHRRLFGLCYFGLQPDYFDAMPLGSGVLVRPIVPTGLLAPGVANPGDVDLLVIPYEQDELVLDRVLAMEIKAIRATFVRQGRSPNDYGFSQANALTDLGFPFVALTHLIVSDTSPADAWRDVSAVRVLDETGRTTAPFETRIDMMPADLVQRAFGRLERNCRAPALGLAAAYIGADSFEPIDGHLRLWTPETRPAEANLRIDTALLDRVAALYEAAPESFMVIPRYDPDRKNVTGSRHDVP